jgi:trigger factor
MEVHTHVFEVHKELLETHEVRLSVTVDDKAVQEAMQQAARSISQKAKIPGFRQGKVPYHMVLRYAGESAVLQEAAENLLKELYPQIIEQAKISPYSSGQLEEMQESPLVFKIRVSLQPTVELGDYQSLRKDREEASVSEEEVETILENSRQQHAILQPVTRTAQMDDEVHIDVKATVEESLILEEQDIEVVMSEDKPFLSPDFVRALVGLSVGEESSFPLILPEAIDVESLRGAEAQFTVKVKAVYGRVLPELDDAFASTVGAFETLEDLKKNIHSQLLAYKTGLTVERYRAALIDALVNRAEAHYPPEILKETLDEMVKDAGEQLRKEHDISLEDALRLDGKTMEQFREEMKPRAARRIKRFLVITEFARRENIEVNDDEVVEEYDQFLISSGLKGRSDKEKLELDSPEGQTLRSNALGRKVMERLEQIGRGQIEPTDEAQAS